MTLPITLAQLVAVMPTGAKVAPLYLDWLNGAMAEFGISTAQRVAAFLAQIKVESMSLTAVSENLNYTADGLANTWPLRYAAKDAHGFYVTDPGTKRHAPNATALRLHRNPVAIANNVYANRMGNSDEASGDGWRFRGSGFIQTTGKSAHLEAALHFDIDPEKIGDWLRSPEGACRSAGLFWATHGLNALADAGQFTACSRVINGGDNGRDERLAAWGIAQRVIV